MKHLIVILLALLIPKLIQSQGSEGMLIGEWKTHFALNQTFEIIETPDQIIGATRLGLVMVEKSDFTIHTFTKVNGLSDYNITALSYNSSNSSVLIGYENGNIDIIKDNNIININDLKLKQLEGGKSIHHFLTHGQETYVATDFGIMVLNVDKREISSTYYIGNNASNLTINQLAMDDAYLYAATAAGVRRVLKDAPNMHIHEAWEVISTDQSNYSNILRFLDGVVFSRGTKGSANTLLYLNNDNTQTIGTVNNFYKMTAADDRLMVTSLTSIQTYDATFTPTESFGNPLVIGEVKQTPAFRDAIVTAANEIWVADHSNGLLNKREDNSWDKYLPHGPVSNQAHQLKFSGENLWLVPGGLADHWNNAFTTASISILSNSGWQHLTRQNSPLFLGATDLLNISPHPENPDHIFVASWGSGLFEINSIDGQPTVVQHHLTPENGLVNIYNDSRRYVRVATTAFDQNNTLWMTNSSVANAIVAYLPHEGKWQRYSYGAISDNMGMAPMMAASTGDMWLAIFRGNAKGLFVWNDNNTFNQNDDIYRSVISQAADSDNRNQGQLLLWDEEGIEITNSIYAMAEDQNGHIWLGTDKGVVVQYQPYSIFTRDRPVFSRIKIARADGTALADYLLDGQIVSSILVDPGNRKWLGTQGGGVYLVSPDGSKQISAFTTDNSPLPSNYINSLAMNEKTGEIFIATGKGVVSFKGSATQGHVNYSDMYAFPNPVRPDFSGNITITGLVAQTTVKITDVSGKLVFETTSVGGQAFWNGRNLWGEAVKSGIYLVFVASEDGSQSAVTKIAIIR